MPLAWRRIRGHSNEKTAAQGYSVAASDFRGTSPVEREAHSVAVIDSIDYDCAVQFEQETVNPTGSFPALDQFDTMEVMSTSLRMDVSLTWNGHTRTTLDRGV